MHEIVQAIQKLRNSKDSYNNCSFSVDKGNFAELGELGQVLQNFAVQHLYYYQKSELR